MECIYGDIWTLRKLIRPARWSIVIPTNVGWKLNGENVMGRGLASDAAKLFPELPFLYGEWCRKVGARPFYYERGRLWCVPSKPLNKEHPHTSWMNKGDYALVRRGLRYLHKQAIAETLKSGLLRVAVPLVGAGNAGLDAKRVRQIIEEELGDLDLFALVLARKE